MLRHPALDTKEHVSRTSGFISEIATFGLKHQKSRENGGATTTWNFQRYHAGVSKSTSVFWSLKSSFDVNSPKKTEGVSKALSFIQHLGKLPTIICLSAYFSNFEHNLDEDVLWPELGGHPENLDITKKPSCFVNLANFLD